MLFVLDHDVDADVGRMLVRTGHRQVRVGAAGLATANDDTVSVFAHNRGGILVTHDQELISRRRRNAFGWHVWMSCLEWDTAELLCQHLAPLVEMAEHREAYVVRISKDAGLKVLVSRWE